ncbi:hypothetical protein RYX36_011169 [Vicia faba]
MLIHRICELRNAIPNRRPPPILPCPTTARSTVHLRLYIRWKSFNSNRLSPPEAKKIDCWKLWSSCLSGNLADEERDNRKR